MAIGAFVASVWRVFTTGAEGACLELWRDPLEAALKESDSTCFQQVKYLTLQQVDGLSPKDLDNLPFCERKGFGAEEEYRVIAWSGESQAAALEFDIQLSWVKHIELDAEASVSKREGHDQGDRWVQ